MKKFTGFSGRNPRMNPLYYDKTTKKIEIEILGYPKGTINIFRGRVTSVEPAKFDWMRFKVFVDAVEPWLVKKQAIITEVETSNK